MSPEIVKEFFENLGPNLEDVPPSHIFNYDETSLRDDPGAEEAFFPAESKYHERVRDSTKVTFSVMFACSADGHMLPPMVVYENKQCQMWTIWTRGGPPGTCYAANTSGWFTMAEFNDWFEMVFLKHIRKSLKNVKQV